MAIHWFVTKPFFDGFIMFVILLSSAALAAEDPVQEYHPRNVLLKYFDYGFTAIFAVECTLKVSPCFYSNRLHISSKRTKLAGITKSIGLHDSKSEETTTVPTVILSAQLLHLLSVTSLELLSLA